jgi:hypothetical protein
MGRKKMKIIIIIIVIRDDTLAEEKRKKKEYKATTEDGLKEKKLHDTERKRCARVTATYRFVVQCNYHNYI